MLHTVNLTKCGTIQMMSHGKFVHTLPRSVHMGTWESEDNLLEPGLSFHHMDPGDGNLVTGLGRKHLYPLSHLTSPCSPK